MKVRDTVVMTLRNLLYSKEVGLMDWSKRIIHITHAHTFVQISNIKWRYTKTNRRIYGTAKDGLPHFVHGTSVSKKIVDLGPMLESNPHLTILHCPRNSAPIIRLLRNTSNILRFKWTWDTWLYASNNSDAHMCRGCSTHSFSLSLEMTWFALIFCAITIAARDFLR